MTIYMIEVEEYSHDDYDGRERYNEVLDRDFGYFTNREDAQAFIDETHAKAKTKHEKAVASHEASIAKWQAEVDRLEANHAEAQDILTSRGLNVRLSLRLPARPTLPRLTLDYMAVVEVKAHS